MIPDRPCKILIIDGCGPRYKTNELLNLMNHQPDIDQFLYGKA